MNNFFYDLNKRLATLADKQDAKQISEDAKASAPKSQLAEAVDVAEAGYSAKAGRAGKDLGKPGKNFSKIAKGAAERYGSKEAGERVAGAVLNKLRHPKESIGQADEGNAFTDELRKTPKGGKFKMGNKEYTDTSDLEEGFKEMDAWLASREKEKGTGRFDKKKISTGTVYTRKPETFDDPETDPEATGGAPARRGRPKGKDKGPERVTAKSYKYKAGRPTKTAEDLDSDGVLMTRPTNCSSESIEREGWRGGMLGEPSVVKTGKKDPNAKVEAWNGLMAIVARGQGMEPAVLKHLKQIARTLKPEELELDEEKVEAGKREFFDRLAPAAKKAAKVIKAISKGKTAVEEESTEKEDTKAEKAGKKVTKDIEYDDKKDRKEKKTDEGKGDGNLANNAKPYDKVTQGDVVAGRLGKDDMGGKKKKEEKVDETTVAGSVATASPSGKSSKGGMQFGKGVYEGFNNQVETMITEGMNISVNMNAGEDGNTHKSITVSADGAEADQLAALLKMAGLQGQSEEACGTCGASPCGCEQTVDEAYGDTDETLNDPDWPTNTETLDAEPELRTYSGGLNGPKSTGQTTVPVIASQLRRQTSMEESAELERSLFKTWKNYKG